MNSLRRCQVAVGDAVARGAELGGVGAVLVDFLKVGEAVAVGVDFRVKGGRRGRRPDFRMWDLGLWWRFGGRPRVEGDVLDLG